MRRIDGNPFNQNNLNSVQNLIISESSQFRPDVIWFEKPLMVLPETLAYLKKIFPRTKLICRQDDNPFSLRDKESGYWKYFINSIPLYDLHFIKRDSDIVNFTNLGGKNLNYYWVGYDAKFYYPQTTYYLQKKDLDFSFVGTNLDDRGLFLTTLQKELKTDKFFISGARWNRSLLRYRFPNQVSSKLLDDDELRNIFQRSHACLGLFCKSNGDEFSGRAFMIAGCGSTIVAPRSPMHEIFFEDKKEAFYYDSTEQCIEIIRNLIANPCLGEIVSKNASIRSNSDGYSIDNRMIKALSDISYLL
ncbi:glycosyltransferase [Polynucleobacter paneuropaeus]|nr:glycosyltransferase [Polynucleobacter paneuropaeus]